MVLPKPLNKSSLACGLYGAINAATYDKDWKIVKDWVPEDNLPAREGFVHVPMLVTAHPGASLSFSFKGTAVGIAVISGADAGVIAYSIDHGPYKKLDLYTEWSSMLHLPWYLLLGSGLNEGRHTLRIKIAQEKNRESKGQACRIVHFLVNGCK